MLKSRDDGSNDWHVGDACRGANVNDATGATEATNKVTAKSNRIVRDSEYEVLLLPLKQ